MDADARKAWSSEFSGGTCETDVAPGEHDHILQIGVHPRASAANSNQLQGANSSHQREADAEGVVGVVVAEQAFAVAGEELGVEVDVEVAIE